MRKFSSLLAHPQTLSLGAAAGSACVLAAALWVQQQGNDACPLCVLQRMGFLGVFACALLSMAASAARMRRGATALRLLGVAAAAGGLAAAFDHLWLWLHPLQTCGLDPLAAVINAWPLTHAMPWMFQADGLCSDLPDVLGLPLPLWSALGLVALGGMLLAAALRRRQD